MSVPAYPETLTKASWDKAKGAIAKMKGETGIGGALDGLYNVYKAVPWQKVDADAAAKLSDPVAVKKAFEEGKGVLNGQIETARKKSFEVSKLAAKFADDFKKNPLTKSTSDYLKKVSDGASHFATTMRDTAMESLKKMHEMAERIDKAIAEAHEIGQEYVRNRKAALVQMTGLKTLFIEGKTRVTQEVQTAHQLADHATANPGTAAADVQKIDAILNNVKSIVATAKKRYSTEADVNKNPVQQKARGGMPKAPMPALEPMMKHYYESSSGEFKAIMDIVAFCLATETELQAGLVAVESSHDIATQAVTAATKTLPEFQEYAKATGKLSTETLAAIAETNKKIAHFLDRYPTLLKSVDEHKDDVPYKKGIVTSATSTVVELRRFATTIQQAVAKQESFARRLAALKPEIQKDGVVKVEIARIAGAIKQAQALFAQATESVKKAEKGEAAVVKAAGNLG